MKKRVISLVLALMVSAVAFAGCSSSSDSADSGSSSAASTDSSSESADASTGDSEVSDTYTVGMTLNLANLTWAELAEAAQAHGEELGMTVTVQNSNDDSTTQVSQIENFIQSGVDAIIVAAVESNAVESVCQEARDAGIKIIAYTQQIENSDAQYLVDAYNTGYACGEAAAKWINENYPDQTVEWASQDLPKYPEIIERAQGIEDAIAELAPNAVLVATLSAEVMEDGQNNAENFMQSHPDIKVITSIGSGGGAGANEGVKSYITEDEYDSFGIFGIDATEQEIMNIINGDPQKVSISLGGGATHGETMIDMAYNFWQGIEQEEIQYMPIEVIDSSNAQEYYDEHFAD